jgi:hypothetical protein
MSRLPSKLALFVEHHINSVDQLEVLLLLFRSPDTYWGADAVAHQLGLSAEMAGRRLRELSTSKLAVEGKTGNVYRINDADKEQMANVTELARLYQEQRLSVVNWIYESNLTRLRSFADAFKIGGSKE